LHEERTLFHGYTALDVSDARSNAPHARTLVFGTMHMREHPMSLPLCCDLYYDYCTTPTHFTCLFISISTKPLYVS